MKQVLTRNNVKVIGEGNQTLVFAHGFGCDQKMWRYILPYFEEDYQIILFDHVGSGESDLTAYNRNTYSTLQGYADDLLEILEELGKEEVIFIGHSVGSMIGMLASIQKPNYFSSLIMIGPSSRYLNDLPDYTGGVEKKDIVELLEMMEMNFSGWADHLAPLAADNADKPIIAREVETSFCSSDPAITRQFAEVTFLSDHREDLQKVSTPSLILQCAEDSIVPIEAGTYLSEHLKDNTFHIISAKGHYPHLSHPEETVSYIKQYVEAG